MTVVVIKSKKNTRYIVVLITKQTIYEIIIRLI